MEEIKKINFKNRQKLLILFIVIFLIAMIIGTIFIGRIVNPYIENLGKYGYLGAFILGLGVNASVVIPAPIFVTPLLTGLAARYDPYSIATIYALGATLGESISYGVGSVIVARLIGKTKRIKDRIMNNGSFYSQAGGWFGKYSGMRLLKKEQGRKEGFYQRLARWTHNKVDQWFKKYGGWAIFVLAIFPFFPFDIAGIVAGTAKYPFYKFFLFCFAGRVIKYIIMIAGGIEIWNVIFN